MFNKWLFHWPCLIIQFHLPCQKNAFACFFLLIKCRNRMRVCEALPRLKCLLLLFITPLNPSHPNIKNYARSTTAFAWSSNDVRKSWRNSKRRRRTSNRSFQPKKKNSTRWDCCQSKLRLNWWEFLFRCQSRRKWIYRAQSSRFGQESRRLL